MGVGEAPLPTPGQPPLQPGGCDPDSELVARMARGDQKALEELYDRYAPAVWGLVSRLVGDPRDREEVLQDAFLTVWRKAATYDGRRGRLFSWLMAIAHHRALDLLRRRKHQPSPASANQRRPGAVSPGGAGEVGAHAAWSVAALEDHDALLRALRRLRPEEQQVVWLAYFQGYTHREIAARFSIPLGTVKSRMRSAVEHLRELLVEEGQRPPADSGPGP